MNAVFQRQHHFGKIFCLPRLVRVLYTLFVFLLSATLVCALSLSCNACASDQADSSDPRDAIDLTGENSEDEASGTDDEDSSDSKETKDSDESSKTSSDTSTDDDSDTEQSAVSSDFGNTESNEVENSDTYTDPVETDSVYASFDAAAATGKKGVKLDASHSSYGYLAMTGSSGKRLKVRIIKTSTYTYDLSSDGTPDYYPLQQGSGTYRVVVFRNVRSNKYAQIFSTTISAKLVNKYQPFMHPNIYVNYKQSSKCVKKAAKITQGINSDVNKIAVIYKWLTKHIKYDYKKARTVADGYIPNPDRTLRTKKGICFDYAALAASMIRSLQIPCKLITGYVQPNDLYHSWNMIYVRGKGWISTNIKAKTKQWSRIDTTFVATGGNSSYVGNGTNYTTRYTY